MLIKKSRSLNSFHTSSAQGCSSTARTPPYPLFDPAMLLSASGSSGQHHQIQAGAHQGSAACDQAKLGASNLQGNHTLNCTQIDDDEACRTGNIEIGSFQQTGNQQQTRARPEAYNLAARLANRSNGPPLATIVEQGSYSTLNSHGSLLSVGRFPSLRAAENTSPNRSSNRVSRSLDDRALYQIEEDSLPGHQSYATPGASRQLHHGEIIREPCLVPAAATPINTTPSRQSRCPGPGASSPDCDAKNSKFKCLFRGVLQNVQAASRSRSRSRSQSSSATLASVVDGSWEHRPEASENNTDSRVEACTTSQSSHKNHTRPYQAPKASFNAVTTAKHKSHARNRPSAREVQSLPMLPPSKLDLEAESASPYLLKPSIATHSESWERSTSVRLVTPDPRDAAPEGCIAGTRALSIASRNNSSAEQASLSVSVYGDDVSPLVEHGYYARDSSRNASFCSTMSTSYSGTVLGIDVDLQHEYAHAVRSSRSPTPVAPVWFTPQPAELELQASVPESPPESTRTPPPHPPYRSMTSSALTSLLPIAAASGIVRPNYNTPKLSFFSPSGNLIQPEWHPTPTTSISDLSGSPTATTTGHSEFTSGAQTALSASKTPPCARPSLIPMTTTPTSSASLPAHIKYHHNYRQPEQIDSTVDSAESFIVPAPAVKGCDGMVRSESFHLRTGTPPSHVKIKARPQNKRHRSTRSIAEELKYEAKFHKARLITAATTSCTRSGKGITLRKRRGDTNVVVAHAYVSMPHKHSNKVPTKKNMRNDRHAKNQQDEGVLGPLAGHALRIIFCQPYDGAGKPTHTVISNTPCIGSHYQRKNGKMKKDHGVRGKEVDADLPNARVAGKSSDCKDGSSRSRDGPHKKQRASHASRHTRVRSDSAVSVGTALRVATAGA